MLLVFNLLFASFLLMFAPAAHAESAHSSHQAHSSRATHDTAPAPVPADGHLWPTDENLRKAMETIRTLIHENEGKEISSQKGEEIQNTINEQINFIISNCKLSPEADAAFHLVLADMMEGSEVIAGKTKDHSPADGFQKINQAFDTYAKTFDHPGWAVKTEK